MYNLYTKEINEINKKIRHLQKEVQSIAKVVDKILFTLKAMSEDVDV